MEDVLELQKLTNLTSKDIDTEKLDRVYKEILLPKFKWYAKKFKKNTIRLTDNLHCPKAKALMKELFNDKFRVQSLIETEMKAYLEAKGYKVIRWEPSYSVEVAW